jgi:hypothetical protein
MLYRGDEHRLTIAAILEAIAIHLYGTGFEALPPELSCPHQFLVLCPPLQYPIQ